jgi:hypothetical protein
LKIQTRKMLIYGPLGVMVFVCAWIVLIELSIVVNDPGYATAGVVRSNDRLIQNYVRAWGEVPQTLNDIRLFAIQTGKHFSSFDAWGERFEYLRLGKVNYTIRSFGADGVQNRPSTPVDPGSFRWGLMADQGLRYNDQDGSMHARPSVVLFAGADDSQGRWHAKLFVDPVSGSRRLLVKNREQENLFMLAPHDGVEEFLWIPGEEKIAFTASQSSRYSDGVFIWDLKTDEAFNLFALDGDMSDLDPGNKQKRLYVAISSVRMAHPPGLEVFAMPSSEILIDPEKFIHPKNLHVFELGEKIKHILPAPDSFNKTSLFNLEFLGMTTVASGGKGNGLQRAWLKLPMGGDWEKAVMSWQEFATAHGKTQLAPYAVWGLAMFYGEAAREAGLSSKSGQIFNSYSIELGTALSQMPIAPGYVRAIGAWMGARH